MFQRRLNKGCFEEVLMVFKGESKKVIGRCKEISKVFQESF